ncbi:MAG: endolytic transglycosylase MltG, partial [Deltaproteobacteria bacterium]|nr:endolytic transglycosylase MltG [Deltaproteobacteria bacterium]
MSWKSRLFRGLLVLLLAWLLTSFFFYRDLRNFARRPTVKKTTVVKIGKGSSLKAISRQLAARGLITSPWRFAILVRLRQLENRLRAGEYELRAGDTPADIIDRLAAGRVKEYRLTIPEGLTATEIGRLLAGKICRPEEYQRLLTD